MKTKVPRTFLLISVMIAILMASCTGVAEMPSAVNPTPVVGDIVIDLAPDGQKVFEAGSFLQVGNLLVPNVGTVSFESSLFSANAVEKQATTTGTLQVDQYSFGLSLIEVNSAQYKVYAADQASATAFSPTFGNIPTLPDDLVKRVIVAAIVGIGVIGTVYYVVEAVEAAVEAQQEFDLEAIDWSLVPTVAITEVYDVDFEALTGPWQSTNHWESQQLISAWTHLVNKNNGKVPRRGKGDNGTIEIRVGKTPDGVAHVLIAIVFHPNVAFIGYSAPVKNIGHQCPPAGCITLGGGEIIDPSTLVLDAAWMMASRAGHGDMRPFWLDVGSGLARYEGICAKYNAYLKLAEIRLH